MKPSQYPRPRARRSYVRRLIDYPPPTPQPTPCRLWQGPLNGRGYGSRPDHQLVHRWVWEQINGPVPEGMHVLHKCDNRACFRYDHLFLGTNTDNMRDMAAKGRNRYVVPTERYRGPRARDARGRFVKKERN